MSARLLAGLALAMAMTARPAAAQTARDAGTADAAEARAVSPDGASPDAATASVPAAAAATPAVVVVPVVVPVQGRVLEKGTRQPFAGAVIAIDGAPTGETDAAGRFRIGVAAGRHDLSIKVAGQETIHQEIEARVETATEEQIFRVLTPGSGVRYATTVRADRPEIPKIEVSGQEARQTAGASGDPLRVIGSLPGVNQIAWPAALYVVRGANPGNTGFFLDGIRVPELFHLGLELSVINPYLIDGVDFYPGGSPASYGPYVSGIMAARTSAPPADRPHASADVTWFDAGGIATTPWDSGRGTALVAARYSYTGALFSVLQNNTILRYGDYQLRLDHPWAGGQATLFAFGAVDDVGFTNLSATKEYGALQFHRLDLRWRRAAGGGRLLVGITGGADWATSTLFDNPIDVRSLSLAPRLVYTHPLGARVDLEVGASGNLQTFATQETAFEQQVGDLGAARNALSQAAYATVMVRAGERLIISPGLRADLFAEQGTTAFFVEPRLDVLYKISEAVALRADGGRYAQMPSLPVSVPGFEAFGLADFGAQTSIGGSLGAEIKLPGQVTLGVTGYYQQLHVTDVRNIDIEGPNDVTATDFLVVRDGMSYGAELLLRRADVGRFYGWLAYTLSWSLRYDEDGVLGRSDWDERHILNLVAGYRLGRSYTLGARFHLNTGRWAPIIDGGGTYEQLPTYYQIDLRAERRFVFDRFVMDLYADFANITDNAEVLQLDAGTSYASGQPQMVRRDVLQLPLPTIGVHAQF